MGLFFKKIWNYLVNRFKNAHQYYYHFEQQEFERRHEDHINRLYYPNKENQIAEDIYKRAG